MAAEPTHGTETFDPGGTAGKNGAAASKPKTKAAKKPTKNGGIVGSQLRALIEWIERLDGERQTIQDDIKAVYGEAKGNGFDTKVMRQVVRLRKLDAAERQEQAAILNLYLHALGMTPIEKAIEKDKA